MNSIYQLIQNSEQSTRWRKFRLPAETWHSLNSQLKSRVAHAGAHRLPYPIEGRISMADENHAFACIAEPSVMSPGPFRETALNYSVAFGNSIESVDDCLNWFALSAEECRPDADETTLVQYALIEAAERGSLTELEARVMRAARLADVIDLEGEPLFVALAKMIQHLFSPVYLEVQPENATDFWGDREENWAWHEPRDDARVDCADLVPRHRLALYRRSRVTMIEDTATAAEFTQGRVLRERGFLSAILIPLTRNERRLGVVKLFFASPLIVLPSELEAIELFRAEFSTVFDWCRKFSRTQKLATIDGLTQLFNHRFLRDQLRTEFQRARRYKKMMSFIMIDIDDFKSYNDTFGHLAGDRVLAEVAATIRSAVRDIDFVARYGGEEFALILPEITAENGLIVAEKIRKAVEMRALVTEDGESMGSITVSCGVTDNLRAEQPEELISRADRALYWVKRHGRNLVKMAEPEMHEV